MDANPYQAPRALQGDHGAAISELSRHAAFVLACFSFTMASCFVLLMVLCLFDATFSVIQPPWQDETGISLIISSWCMANFVTWAATVLAALRRRKRLVVAALLADVCAFLPMAIL
jgi:hypothetical protein